MRTALSTLTIASALLLASCSGNEQENVSTTTVPAATTNQAPAKAVALNPPHGEPGHNCALPVGAPLDGTPPPNLVKPNLAPIPAKTTAGSGLNPPHGEPGHDCAIPVGAPLTNK